MTQRLDIVIFGATGFTGKYTVKEAARLAKNKGFTWGVAGRRREALEAVLKEFAPEAENIPIIIADIKNEESLKIMAEQAKAIVNVVGPFRFYGEPVIKACIAAKTHHVDISGEPWYMEKMQLEYNKAAQDAEIYIISACGFDSIPCDLGIVFVQNKFGGDVNTIETYLETTTTKEVKDSTIVNYATWESAIHGFAHANDLREIRRKLYPERLPKLTPVLEKRGLVHRSPIVGGWSTIFPGSDRSVALRSQRFYFNQYKERPVQIQTYVTFKSYFKFLFVSMVGAVFGTLAKFSFGRRLLLNYPKLFSAGMVSRDNPKEEFIENTFFTITLHAKGWNQKLAEPTDVHKEAPNKEMIAKVRGVNPGYGATCTAALISALTILKENHMLPNNGGVLTPGGAFAKTAIIDELSKHKFKFEVVSTIDKSTGSKLESRNIGKIIK